MNHISSTPQKPHHTSSVRLKMWEEKFPGCGDDFIEFLDSRMPTMGVIATWKSEWIETSPYRMTIMYNGSIAAYHDTGKKLSLRKQVSNVTEQAKIHPYFWDLIGRWPYRDRFEVVFFKEEHLVMFKLSW